MEDSGEGSMYDSVISREVLPQAPLHAHFSLRVYNSQHIFNQQTQ